MKNNAILSYKNDDYGFNVDVFEIPTMFSIKRENKKWDDLILNIGNNNELLKYKPLHFTLSFLNEKNEVYSKFIIIDVKSYKKVGKYGSFVNGQNVRISFENCVNI